MCSMLLCLVTDYVPAIQCHFRHLKLYDFLWLDDLHTNFANFLDAEPGQWAIINEINRHVPNLYNQSIGLQL